VCFCLLVSGWEQTTADIEGPAAPLDLPLRRVLHHDHGSRGHVVRAEVVASEAARA
jgi:hypothetical protein